MNPKRYAELLRDPRWDVVRRQALADHEYTCDDCGATNTELHVHHGYYRAGRMPWEYPPSALHVLCMRCHQELHQPIKGQATKIIHLLAKRMEMPSSKPPDIRPQLWEMARANERGPVDASRIMKLLSWLCFSQHITHLALLEAVSREVAHAQNPYALLHPGGKAIFTLIGRVAEQRAARERAENEAADANLGITRR